MPNDPTTLSNANYTDDNFSFVHDTSWATFLEAFVRSSTTVVSSPSDNPSQYGHSLTFTATVSATSGGGVTPTGTVTFMDGTNSIGTGSLNDGTATFTTTSLSVATHSISAVLRWRQQLRRQHSVSHDPDRQQVHYHYGAGFVS